MIEIRAFSTKTISICWGADWRVTIHGIHALLFPWKNTFNTFVIFSFLSLSPVSNSTRTRNQPCRAFGGAWQFAFDVNRIKWFQSWFVQSWKKEESANGHCLIFVYFFFGFFDGFRLDCASVGWRWFFSAFLWWCCSLLIKFCTQNDMNWPPKSYGLSNHLFHSGRCNGTNNNIYDQRFAAARSLSRSLAVGVMVVRRPNVLTPDWCWCDLGAPLFNGHLGAIIFSVQIHFSSPRPLAATAQIDFIYRSVFLRSAWSVPFEWIIAAAAADWLRWNEFGWEPYSIDRSVCNQIIYYSLRTIAMRQSRN